MLYVGISVEFYSCNAECHYAECLSDGFKYAECCHACCSYAECLTAESRGENPTNTWKSICWIFTTTLSIMTLCIQQHNTQQA
jgi:hypothetical protein